MQNVALIVKMWDLVNKNHEVRVLKDPKTYSDPNAKKNTQIKERIKKGLLSLRKEAQKDRAGDIGACPAFVKKKDTLVLVMSQYCRNVRKSKEYSTGNRDKYFKAVAKVTVIVDGLDPATVEGGEPPQGATVNESQMDDVDTARLELALDTTQEANVDNINFDDEEVETPRSATTDDLGSSTPTKKPPSKSATTDDLAKEKTKPDVPKASQDEFKALLIRLKANDEKLKVLEGTAGPLAVPLRQIYKNLLPLAARGQSSVELAEGLDDLEARLKDMANQVATETPPNPKELAKGPTPAVYGQLRQIMDGIGKAWQGEVQKLLLGIRQNYKANGLLPKIEKGMEAALLRLRTHHDGFCTALDAPAKAKPSDDLTPFHATAVARLRTFRSFVTTDSFMKEVDKNGLVGVNVAKMLNDALGIVATKLNA